MNAFIAGDNTILREILHPNNDKIDLPYSLAHAAIPVGKASLPHALKSTEVYYFLRGNGIIHIGETVKAVEAGDLVVVPPSENQHVRNTGTVELVFLCIVSPFWKAADEIVF